MNKNRDEQERYKNDLTRSKKEDSTFSFEENFEKNSNKQKDADNNRIGIGSKEMKKTNLRERIKKKFSENPHLSILLTFIFVLLSITITLTVFYLGYVVSHDGDIKVIKVNLEKIDNTISEIQKKYEDNLGLYQDLENIKDKIKTLENRLNFENYISF
jgi:hypothetical protein